MTGKESMRGGSTHVEIGGVQKEKIVLSYWSNIMIIGASHQSNVCPHQGKWTEDNKK